MLEIKSLLLATPTTGGLIKSQTAETLVNLVKTLTKLGVDTTIRIINDSDIVTVRNKYANMVHDSNEWDALLFVDSDMSFKPALIVRLIKSNTLISAAACTKKRMELGQFAKSFALHNDIELARAQSVQFNTLLSWGRPSTIGRNGAFIRAAAVGMAVCLIRKQALEAMVAGGVVEKRMDVYEGIASASWGFFDYTKHYEGITLTEDYAFCYRWTKLLGKPLWVCTDAAVDHIGDFHYRGNYSLKLESQVRPSIQTEDTPGAASPTEAGSAKVAAKRRKRSSAD